GLEGSRDEARHVDAALAEGPRDARQDARPGDDRGHREHRAPRRLARVTRPREDAGRLRARREDEEPGARAREVLDGALEGLEPVELAADRPAQRDLVGTGVAARRGVRRRGHGPQPGPADEALALREPVRMRCDLRQLAVPGPHERVERDVEHDLVDRDDRRAADDRVERRDDVALDGVLDRDDAARDVPCGDSREDVGDGRERREGPGVVPVGGRPRGGRLVGERPLGAEVPDDAHARAGSGAGAHRGSSASGPGTKSCPGRTASTRWATPRSAKPSTSASSVPASGHENAQKKMCGPASERWLRRCWRSIRAWATSASVSCREPRWSSRGPNASHTWATPSARGGVSRLSRSPYQIGAPSPSSSLPASSAYPSAASVPVATERATTWLPSGPASATRSSRVVRVGTSDGLTPMVRSTWRRSRIPASSTTTWPVRSRAAVGRPTHTHWDGTADAPVSTSDGGPASSARSSSCDGCAGWPRCTTPERPSMLATVDSVAVVDPRSRSDSASAGSPSTHPAAVAASSACAPDSRSLRPSMGPPWCVVRTGSLTRRRPRCPACRSTGTTRP